MSAELHFLNVKKGDCTWIKHPTGHNSVIDVCNANEILKKGDYMVETFSHNNSQSTSVKGNFGQKEYPVNPIKYLSSFGVDSIFRFIITHPDMDHLDGIKNLFKKFNPINVWDTDNEEEKNSWGNYSEYNEDDWKFYKSIRDGKEKNTKRLTLFSGSQGQYYNQNEHGENGGDSLFVLSPTKEILNEAIRNNNYNDCSYVILYVAPNNAKVLITGDSHDKTWEHILNNWEEEVSNCDILLAPHHGRKSNRSYDFLNTVNPKITFFGNASSKDLAYQALSARGLEKFTNNEGGCLIAKFLSTGTEIRCSNKNYADIYCRENEYNTNYDENTDSYYLKNL